MSSFSGVTYGNLYKSVGKSAPMEKARVIVVFPEPKKENGKRLSTDEARALFDEFSGCLDGDINEQAERLGALDEKFENID